MTEVIYEPSAETAMLSCLCHAPANDQTEILTHVREEHFYLNENKLVFRAIQRAMLKGQQADWINVQNDLIATNELDVAGGQAKIAEIATFCPSHTTWKRYYPKLEEARYRRSLEFLASDMVHKARDREIKLEELKNWSETSVMKADYLLDDTDKLSIAGPLNRAIDNIESTIAGTPRIGVRTGLDPVDRYLMFGLRGGDMVVVAARPAQGKAQPLTSKILLCDGTWKEMGDISLGDELASVDGGKSTVIGVYPQGVREIYRITFSDGRTVNADADHLWSVNSCRFAGKKIMTTLEVANTLKKKRYYSRLHVEQHNGMFGYNKLEVDPWLLGFLLGDGCLTRSGVCFSNPEKYIHSRISNATGLKIKKIGNKGCDYCIENPTVWRRHPLRENLKAIGIIGLRSYEKKVPEHIFKCDANTRKMVLAGLLESDGWVCQNSVKFSSASEKLSDGVVRLVRSLGGFASLRVKERPRYTYKGEIRIGRPAYMVTIKLNGIEEFIESPRLLSKMSKRKNKANLTFSSVEYIGDEEAQCIAVSHPSSLYITDGYSVTHNTSMSMQIVEHVAIEQKKRVLIFSLEMTSVALMERMVRSRARVRAADILARKIGNLERQSLARATGEIQSSAILCDDGSAKSIGYIKSVARRAHQKEPLDLIVIDYLQLVRGDTKRGKDNRVCEVEEISGGVKDLAKTLNVPVVVIAQLNRDPDKRHGRPSLSDLKGSSAIEMDADIVMLLHMNEEGDDIHSQFPKMDVIVAKNREGETGIASMVFNKAITRFEPAFDSFSSNSREI